jgi:hypothetical protein
MPDGAELFSDAIEDSALLIRLIVPAQAVMGLSLSDQVLYWLFCPEQTQSTLQESIYLPEFTGS